MLTARLTVNFNFIQPFSMTYNILFILTDQERYFAPESLPSNYSLPGRERLRNEGISFTNHQIASIACSSSRSVIYTGQHMQNTGVFDNLGLAWSKELSLMSPTVGRYLKTAGYHPAYLGKCHLLNTLEEVEVEDAPDVNPDFLSKIMQNYSFEDYFGVGDIIGNTLGGYRSDEFTTSTAIRWLRAEAPKLENEGKPWFLAVNLVNPHDVMYYNTDPDPSLDPDGSEQIQGKRHLMAINREPNHELYTQTWDMDLSPSRDEEDYDGRPSAHKEYQLSRATLVGQFPSEDDRWKRLQDYYLNCIADSDRHICRILEELDALNLTDNTIVIMTSDHGELLGAHQMHGKGATAYKEQLNVPLYISHPDYRSNDDDDNDDGNNDWNNECAALTSHMDIVPTILSMAGVENMPSSLKGHDLTPLLGDVGLKVRDTALFCYNMWLYIDCEYMDALYTATTNPEGPEDPFELGLRPDLEKRGAIRSVTDGQFRYTRYFSPLEHNQPQTIDEIFDLNDVELFNLTEDPFERNNLVANDGEEIPSSVIEKVLEMNQKLNDIIAEEVGKDNGDFLPPNNIGWDVGNLNL